jgi:hypothetical protein
MKQEFLSVAVSTSHTVLYSVIGLLSVLVSLLLLIPCTKYIKRRRPIQAIEPNRIMPRQMPVAENLNVPEIYESGMICDSLENVYFILQLSWAKKYFPSF